MKNAGIRLLVCCLFLLLFFLPFVQAEQSPVDILIFSPYPDDETFACGKTILKALYENKKAKIVFLTKTAINRVELKEEDVVFLNYPEKGLFSLWEKDRNNFLADTKDVLKKYKPKKIYLPYPLNIPKYLSISEKLLGICEEHLAASHFVSLALNELMVDDGNKWAYFTEVTYYFINHCLGDEEGNSKLSMLKPLGSHNELFWDVPCEKNIYLKQLEEEWQEIAKAMKQYGYNVNFAPVVDVMGNYKDRDISIAKKERSYSQYPYVVTELSSAAIKGMIKQGIIPVIKHFPGLGSSSRDTHTWLPEIKISKKELYKKDILPFKKLIKGGGHFWIMVNHAVYPCLDKEPASLSYKIQTEILRKKLGFKGIIIVDELLCMQAIHEYVRRNKIEEPYVGEIVIRAFKAGADLAVLYTHPKEIEKNIIYTVKAVKQALREGRISEADLDRSVKRILKSKERVFKKHFLYLLKEMSLEEKICQRLIMDISEETEAFNKYNLGGLHVRSSCLIEKIQKNAKIPLFIINQHEGGFISSSGLNIFSKSAYSIGKEFERLIIKDKGKLLFSSKEKKKKHSQKQNKVLLSFDQLKKEERKNIKLSLLASLDELIALRSDIKQKGYAIPHPNVVSPLISGNGDKFIIKPFQEVPIVWVKRFSEEEIARCAYSLFKKVFEAWVPNCKCISSRENIILNLKSFKKEIEKIEIKDDKSKVRILCLAAHPDDEDGQALLYFKKAFNCFTYILLATRGQGGENLIGPYLDEELGIIRTKEMEQAASALGVNKVYYLGKKDFGYCLDIDEALDEWGRQDTLKKIVYFFRLIKPHIIVTKHNPDDGHCQHQAFLSLAKKAFDLSGNSKFYPEMIREGLLAWQPLKFYQRAAVAENNDGVLIDANKIISSENKTINQIAREALEEHHSQIQGSCGKECGRTGKIFYQLVKSKTPVNNKKLNHFLDGVSLREGIEEEKEFTLSGMPGVKIAKNLKIGLIEKNSNTLFIALKALGHDFKKIEENFLKEGKLSEFDTIIVGQRINLSSPLDKKIYERFSEFVKNGGNLIVFTVEYGRPALNWQPYPLDSPFNPIDNEKSPLTILAPGHTLFNYPNKINNEDFKGWVQERGLSFPRDYSEEYIELTSCLSPKRNSIKSGYLAADYGRGSYIYTSYSWHRQLREFHLGAYKSFANMIAYKLLKNAENKF